MTFLEKDKSLGEYIVKLDEEKNERSAACLSSKKMKKVGGFKQLMLRSSFGEKEFFNHCFRKLLSRQRKNKLRKLNCVWRNRILEQKKHTRKTKCS